MNKDSQTNTTEIDANTVLYAVNQRMINKHICDQFVAEFSELSPEKQKERKVSLIEDIYKIDNGLFDTKRNIDNPIRFWFNEYRHMLFSNFNSI